MTSDAIIDLPVIERRLAATTAVRQVVHAIGAISRAQLPRLDETVSESSLYLDWVDDVVRRLGGDVVEAPPSQKLVVIVGPQRAYCGALGRIIATWLPRDGAIGLVGDRLAEMVDRRFEDRVLFRLAAASSPDDLDDASRNLASAILEHGREKLVELVYPAGEAVEPHRTIVLAGEVVSVLNPPETYASLEATLDAAVVEVVTSRLGVGIAEALRTEVRARVAAADQAKTACDRKLDALRSQWLVARQAQITNELLEVVAGAEAAG